LPANNKTPALAILPVEFAGWLEEISDFEQSPNLAIAISGGADSMALLLLASDWAHEKNGKTIALTVNHNLREEAAAEAAQVAKWCAQKNMEHHILDWQHVQLPTSAIQQSAREARYSLMTEWCKKNQVAYLLTAHHQGDQIETLFFRLARGSGLAGLACMPPHTIKNGINLLRPLLQAPKSRLIATLKHYNQPWLEDPSNQNTKYTRVHIRNQLQELTNDSEFGNRVTIVSERLQKFRKALENYIVHELANSAQFFPQAYAVLSLREKLSPESFSYLAQILSGGKYPPRTEKLLRFYQEIYAQDFKKRSFSGLLFEPIADGKIIIYREPHAIEKSRIIQAGEQAIWDKRFSVVANTNLSVRALGSDGLKIVRKNSPKLLSASPKPHAQWLKALPSFWHLEELVSVPHINYMSCDSQFSNIKTIAKFHSTKLQNSLLEHLFSL